MNTNKEEFIEFSLLDFIKIGIKRINSVFLITFFITLSMTIYLYSLDDKYESYAILEVSDKSNLNQAQSGLSSLGGLGALTGLADTDNTTTIALEIIKSKDFFDYLINSSENFISQMLDGNKKSYSYEDLHRIYLSNLSILNNKTSKTTRLGFTSTSAENSYNLIQYIIKSLNNYIRDKDVKYSEGQILFLEERIAKTKNPDVKSIISTMIESNLRKAMIFENSDQYMFSFIDSPRVPEKKSSPKRLIIIFLTLILSFIFSFILFAIFEIFKPHRQINT